MLTCSLLLTAVILPGLPAAANLNVRLNLNIPELYFTLSKNARLFLVFFKKNQKKSHQASSFLLYTRWKRIVMPMSFKFPIEELKEQGCECICTTHCVTMDLNVSKLVYNRP
jgi:hypothetical protein